MSWKESAKNIPTCRFKKKRNSPASNKVALMLLFLLRGRDWRKMLEQRWSNLAHIAIVEGKIKVMTWGGLDVLMVNKSNNWNPNTKRFCRQTLARQDKGQLSICENDIKRYHTGLLLSEVALKTLSSLSVVNFIGLTKGFRVGVKLKTSARLSSEGGLPMRSRSWACYLLWPVKLETLKDPKGHPSYMVLSPGKPGPHHVDPDLTGQCEA